MKRFLSLLLCLICSIANAQFIPGQILTAQQLNNQFALYVPFAGGTMTGALTVPSLTVTGTATFPSGTISLSSLGQINGNTVLGNSSGTGNTPSSVALPSCSTSSSAVLYTSGTGFSCNTAINASSLGGSAANTYAPLASPALTGTPTAPTATAGTSTTQVATTAFAQTAVTGGGNAGSFTTITSSGLDAMLYTTTNALSVPTATSTIVTTWTKVQDRLSTHFNATTGVYTAPTTGYYYVCAALGFTGTTTTVGATYGVLLNVNSGASTYNMLRQADSTSSFIRTTNGCLMLYLAATNTLSFNAYQSSGSTTTLTGSAAQNFFSLYQMP
jgi:hypothetical protein